MTDFDQWASRWGIPAEAVAELRSGLNTISPAIKSGAVQKSSEAWAQQQVRLEAPKQGVLLMRNNNGATQDATGRLIRYGLANESKAMNKQLKSSDLIGITPTIITPADVGRTLGVFTSIETKRPGWRYTGNARERAQLNWILLVKGYGGIGKFSTGPKDLWSEL